MYCIFAKKIYTLKKAVKITIHKVIFYDKTF